MLRFTLVFMLLAHPALATQEYILPTLFDVTGVATDDVLNIRETPDATAPVIGALAPDATRIEVVQEQDGWGQVNSGERAGWVSMRFLSYRTDVWHDGTVPDGFACFGTEPFWDVRIDGGDLVLSGLDIEQERHLVQSTLGTGVFRDPARAVVAEGITLVETPQICSDGMSDRSFGMRATLIRHGDTPSLLSGCCRIGN